MAFNTVITLPNNKNNKFVSHEVKTLDLNLSVEGLFSTGPTPSSLKVCKKKSVQHFVKLILSADLLILSVLQKLDKFYFTQLKLS